MSKYHPDRKDLSEGHIDRLNNDSDFTGTELSKEEKVKSPKTNFFQSKIFLLLIGLFVFNIGLFLGLTSTEAPLQREQADRELTEFLKGASPEMGQALAPVITGANPARDVSIREMFELLAEAEGVQVPSEQELKQLELQDSLVWEARSH